MIIAAEGLAGSFDAAKQCSEIVSHIFKDTGSGSSMSLLVSDVSSAGGTAIS